MVAGNREVVFILKAQADGSLQQAFADVGKRALDTQERLNKSTQASVERVSKERIKDFEKELDDINKARKQAADEQIRAAKQVASENAKVEREMTAAYKQAVREQVNEAKQAAAEKLKIEREMTTAYNQAVQERMRIEQQANQTSQKLNQSLTSLAASRFGILMGSVHVATGLTTMFASNEKDAQKLMRSLSMIHGAYFAFRGIEHIIHGVSSAYRAAVAAEAAAVALSTAAKQASIGVTLEAAAADTKAAVAAESNAIANMHLAGASAVGGAGRAAGVSGMLGRGLIGAHGALAAIGGGSAAVGAGILAAPFVAAIAGYKIATHETDKEAREAEQRTGLMESGFEARHKSTEEGAQRQETIEHILRERRESKEKLEQSTFQRSIAKQQRALELKTPKLGETMRDWTTSREELRLPGTTKHEPGAADFQKIDDSIAADRAGHAVLIKQMEEEATKAAADVESKQHAQVTAEANAKRFQDASVMASIHAISATQAQQRNYWSQNWVRKTVGWFGQGYITAPRELQEQAEFAQAQAGLTSRKDKEGHAELVATGGGAAGQAGAKKATAKEAAESTEASLKRQHEILEKINSMKEADAQREIKHQEEVLAKLREMHEQYLHNAQAMEKASQSFFMHQVLANPEERHHLTRAIRHYQAGTATNKELGFLEEHARGSRKEQLRKELAGKATPEMRAANEFLAGDEGSEGVKSARAKADDMQARIKEKEDLISKAREGAVAAADSMADRVATVVEKLFDAMNKRFSVALTRAFEKIEADIVSKAARDKAGVE